VNDARQLAQSLGIEFHVVPIREAHDAYERMLGPIFTGRRCDPSSPMGEDLTSRTSRPVSGAAR